MFDRAKGRLRHLFGGGEVSAADFEAVDPLETVDPLGGILHPAYREMEIAKAKAKAKAKANRSSSFIWHMRQALDWYIDWRRARNEPNIRTYETELIVAEEEMRNLEPPAGAEKEMLEAAADVLEGPPVNWDEDPPPFYERRDQA